MRAKKAKAIRKIISQGLQTAPTTYMSEFHQFQIHTNEGPKQFASETLRAPMGRRAYQIAKKIYKRFSVMPRLGLNK